MTLTKAEREDHNHDARVNKTSSLRVSFMFAVANTSAKTPAGKELMPCRNKKMA
jgi:hypothetical protein